MSNNWLRPVSEHDIADLSIAHAGSGIGPGIWNSRAHKHFIGGQTVNGIERIN